MISVNEKLNIFAHFLLSRQENKSEATFDASALRCQAIQKEADERLEKEKKRLKNRNEQIIYRDTNMIIADGKSKAKDALLSQEKELLEDFQKTIWDTAKQGVGEDAYQNYLVKCIEKVPNTFKAQDALVVTVLEKDESFVKEAIQKAHLDNTMTYKVVTGDFIGGLVITDANGRVNLDLRVERLIEENQRLIGKKLKSMMNKVTK